MRRRDFVKGMVAVPLTARTLLGQQKESQPVAVPQTPAKAAPPPAAETAPTRPLRRGLLEFQGAPITSSVPDLVANTEAHFFTDAQFETLTKLSAILMPPLNGYPGALQTGAPEFIDFLIGASPVDRQNLYRSGLNRLNADAKKQFGIPFAQVSAAQASTLLTPWLRTWMPDHPPQGKYEQFINVAHQDIRTATMNSQAWSVAATSSGERQPGIGLYWSPIDPDIQRLV
jgi:hypothetical protein